MLILKRAISVEAIRGLPKLKIVEDNIYGEHTRMSHPRLELQVTSKVLELLRMDLMGPICKLRALVERGMLLWLLMTSQGLLG